MNSGNEKITDKELFSLVGEVSEKVKGEVMTIAEKLEARGKAEGMTLNNIRVIEKMLSENFEWSVITKITGYSETQYKSAKASIS